MQKEGKEDKNKKLIMVVPRKLLFTDSDFFEGFKPYNEVDFERRILDNYGFMTRRLAEEDPNYKQPIAYSIIINPKTNEVFGFQRSSQDKEYHEKRLQGKFSWGIGGHIEKSDLSDQNFIQRSMMREIVEEIGFNNNKLKPTVLGYINKEEDVHAVHFGILYLIETDSTVVLPKAKEIAYGQLMHINELEEICRSSDVEEWSRIALDPLKRYIHYSSLV